MTMTHRFWFGVGSLLRFVFAVTGMCTSVLAIIGWGVVLAWIVSWFIHLSLIGSFAILTGFTALMGTLIGNELHRTVPRYELIRRWAWHIPRDRADRGLGRIFLIVAPVGALGIMLGVYLSDSIFLWFTRISPVAQITNAPFLIQLCLALLSITPGVYVTYRCARFLGGAEMHARRTFA